MIAGYAWTTGGIGADPALPLEDAKLTAHTAVLAYARALNVWGTSGKIQVALPYTSLSGTARFMGAEREREVSGLHDPVFRLAVNLYGAPALSFQEFASYQQDLIVGVSVAVTPPLGQYDEDKLVNIGNNRWSIKPELGISQAFGPLAVELAAGAIVFTKNDAFLGRTREQAPLFTFQASVVYDFGRGFWGALTSTYVTGGQTTVDGERADDRRDNVRIGGTLTIPVTRHHSVKLYGSTAVHTRRGPDFDVIGMAWQYRWGAGF